MVKTGIQINVADMGLNVLFDLVDFSSQIDALTLAKADGKNLHYSAPMNLSEMTLKGKLRG